MIQWFGLTKQSRLDLGRIALYSKQWQETLLLLLPEPGLRWRWQKSFW